MKARLLSTDEVAVAAEILMRGGIVALPTDTVYGLGCNPFNGDAVERLFEVKVRETKPIPVLCSDKSAAESLVEFGGVAEGLARTYWPGALTIVAPIRESVLIRLPPTLHQRTGWLGVRVPDNAVAASLAKEAGGSITGTSANISGRPSCRTASEVSDALGESIDAIIDGGYLGERESTVVKVADDTVEVLREGSIGVEQGTNA